MSTQGEPRIAFIHDELTRRGGAESVFEELVDAYPKSDIYALYAGKPVVRVNDKLKPVNTTFLQKFPLWFRRHPSRLLPLLPYAAEQIDLSAYDLVISSASGFAKSVITRANVPHICYCHTPTRYLWDNAHEIVRQRKYMTRGLSHALLHLLRLADYAAAQRVDHFIANSEWTKQRIEAYYRRPSTVIHPPVDVSFFTPGKQQGNKSDRPFVCVGRLTPSKKFEQAIAVCEKLNLPLIIIGRGQHLKYLQKVAGKHTTFIGYADRSKLRDYLRNARALLQPGEEDFGIAAVEAQACGTPVIAYGRGGSRETVRQGETGLLYKLQTVESLAEAIRTFIATENRFRSEIMQHHSFRFSRERFLLQIQNAIDSATVSNGKPRAG